MDIEDGIAIFIVLVIGYFCLHVALMLLGALFRLPGKLMQKPANQHKMTASSTLQYKVKDLDNWGQVQRQNPFKDAAS